MRNTITNFLFPHLIIVFTFLSISLHCFSSNLEAPTDILTANNSLSYNQTLISAGGKFELDFFGRGNPKRYYLGIRYKDIPTNDVYIWVANRDIHLSSTSCSMKLDGTGNLIILEHGSSDIIRWSSNILSTSNPVVQLLDTGNLVIREADDHASVDYLWQSFDYPTDTLVPGQKLGWNVKPGLDSFLRSWLDPDDPGPGNFSFELDKSGKVDVYLRDDSGQVLYRTGPWLEVGESSADSPSDNSFNFQFFSGLEEAYYMLALPPSEDAKSRLTMTYNGSIEEWRWNPDLSQWTLFAIGGKGQYCDRYNECGSYSYSVCNSSGQYYGCRCLPGFEPMVHPDELGFGGRSKGCARKAILGCGSGEFSMLENMKLPTTSSSFVSWSTNVDECRDTCMNDCTCSAYASANWQSDQGVLMIGCITWRENLTDMRASTTGGQNLYIRLAASANKTGHSMFAMDMDEIKSIQSLQFDLQSIKAATRNFSDDNNLGEGGFGEVYKGILNDGQEIAVKRLSKASRQGTMEFKTEVLLVAKLQHKNLVRFLGFCLGSKEKILVYEYLRNSSLDKFLFDSTKKLCLNWQLRFKVILGVARGLMYLHEDSRLKIIHRDLKPSNILLDESMNPKIADFGLAKLFEVDQTQDETRRIVGTYGYMAPEYAITGHFSMKSDVYSFGIIVLEIVSGQKNKFFGRRQHEEALLHRAWRLWNEERPLDLLDTTLDNKFSKEKVTMAIQIGLLCIQQNAVERPNMTTIVAALSDESISLPLPKAPNFFRNSCTTSTGTSTYSGTKNITDICPR